MWVEKTKTGLTELRVTQVKLSGTISGTYNRCSTVKE